MIRILISDSAYAPIAAWVRTPLLVKIRGWQKKGARVTLICSTEAKIFYQEKLPGVEFLTFPFSWKSKTRWGVPFEFLRANFLIMPFVFKTRDKFDIVYSHTSTLDILFFPWVLKLFDKKVRWFTMMDNLVPKPSERPGNYLLKVIPYLAFLIGNLLLRKTDGMFVVTNLLKKYYEKRGIKVIKTGNGNGLETESFTDKVVQKTPNFTALFGGRLNPAKGIFDLIEITKKVVKEDGSFTLGIMGEGEEAIKKKMSELIKKYELSEHIFLLGNKNTQERWALYKNSNFFLFPSYAEGCPQIVLEAFAANKPVIGYDLAEYQDAFKKYLKNGQLIIFKKGDANAIVKYILNIKGKKFHFHNRLSDYSWDSIVDNEWKAFVGVL